MLSAVAHYFRNRLGRAPAPPRSPDDTPPSWRRFADLARARGIDRLYLILSFDCDRHEDAAAAEQIDDWLAERGMARIFAVPGTMLEAAPDIYRRLAKRGASFVNHGYRPHTEFRDGRYHSSTFYHTFTESETDADIRAGHRAISQILEVEPRGFRAPHFGLIDATRRRIIYRTLRELGYRYSSSTLPAFGLDNGPLADVQGLTEFACTGNWLSFESILDSWSHVESPDRPVVTDTYGDLAVRTLSELASRGLPGLLNWYADPSHVASTDGLVRLLDACRALGIPAVDFTDILALPFAGNR